MELLSRKNPWAPDCCEKDDCLVCSSTDKKEGKATPCSLEGICYVISCTRCKAANVDARYFGESARTAYLRGKEHAKGQEKNLEDNPLHKHNVVHHQGEKGQYNMSVLRQHKKPLGRQIQEAVEIESSTADIILNSKGEFNTCKLPRITLEVGERILATDYNGQQQPIGFQATTGSRGQAPSTPEMEEERIHIQQVEDWEQGVRARGRRMIHPPSKRTNRGHEQEQALVQDNKSPGQEEKRHRIGSQDNTLTQHPHTRTTTTPNHITSVMNHNNTMPDTTPTPNTTTLQQTQHNTEPVTTTTIPNSACCPVVPTCCPDNPARNNPSTNPSPRTESIRS